MLRRRLIALLTALAALVRPAAAQEAEPLAATAARGGPAWGLEVQPPLLTEYVFRGLELNEQAVMQPAAFAYRAWDDGSWLGVGAFANVGLLDFSGRTGGVTHMDYAAEGATPALGGHASAGCAATTFPESLQNPSIEGFVAWECAAGSFTPRVELWYGLAAAEGFSARARLAHGRSLGSNFRFDAEASLRAMDREVAAVKLGAAASGLTDFTASARLVWVRSASSELALTLLGSTLLDGASRASAVDPNPVWVALTWGLAF